MVGLLQAVLPIMAAAAAVVLMQRRVLVLMGLPLPVVMEAQELLHLFLAHLSLMLAEAVAEPLAEEQQVLEVQGVAGLGD
jgi:hypothetical protein